MRGFGMRVRRSAGLAVFASALLFAAGCGAVSGSESILGKDTIVIGVNEDQPGLGDHDGRTYRGFDIDVARYIADYLGAEPRFVTVTSATRQKMIQTGEVDLVVASYSITPDRKADVAFAGPYYVAHQDILVRAPDASAIEDVRDLEGRRLCRVPGSVSFPRVAEERGVKVEPRDAPGYRKCVERLAAREVDAVSTDDLILAGLAAEVGRGSLRMVNAPISDEPYGIGIAKDDLDGCAEVNQAITEMYQKGHAPRLLAQWFGPVGLEVTKTVPQFEGCD
jgi:ABC-type amino acid transport substrate-binding protein